MRTLILCAGDGTRWGNHLGVPKHLIPIEGQRLLNRTAAQFAEHGEVEVVVSDITDTRYWVPTPALIDIAHLDPTRYGVDKLLSARHCWDPTQAMVLAFGDVWFSDDAVETIAKAAAGDRWAWVARFGPSAWKPHGEGFAFVLPVGWLGDFETAANQVVEMRRRGEIRRALGWEVYRWLAGGDPQRHDRLPGLVEVDDFTDDFDTPIDYRRWLVARNWARRHGWQG